MFSFITKWLNAFLCELGIHSWSSVDFNEPEGLQHCAHCTAKKALTKRNRTIWIANRHNRRQLNKDKFHPDAFRL